MQRKIRKWSQKLTCKQMPQRLSIALAQVKADNISEILLTYQIKSDIYNNIII